MRHTIDQIHHFTMSSMAFWLALIIGGGPLGLSGAQAALLTEVRDSALMGFAPGYLCDV